MEPTPPRPVVRVCRKCSTQTDTAGDFCPNCGTSFMRRTMSKRTKVIVLSIAGVLLIGGGTTAAVLAANHRAKAEAVAAAAMEAEAEQEREEGRQRQARLDLIAEMEDSITEDAEKKRKEGLLDEPVKYTSCDPLGGGSVDDLTALTTTFTCLGVYKDNDDGTSTGYSVSATMNWTEESWSWQFGG